MGRFLTKIRAEIEAVENEFFNPAHRNKELWAFYGQYTSFTLFKDKTPITYLNWLKEEKKKYMREGNPPYFPVCGNCDSLGIKINELIRDKKQLTTELDDTLNECHKLNRKVTDLNNSKLAVRREVNILLIENAELKAGRESMATDLVTVSDALSERITELEEEVKELKHVWRDHPDAQMR